jgi:hypothetical protein
MKKKGKPLHCHLDPLSWVFPERLPIDRDEEEVVIRVECIRFGGRHEVGTGIILKPASDIRVECCWDCIEKILDLLDAST